MEQWWKDTERVKPEFWAKYLPQCYFVHYTSHMDWPGTEPQPPLYHYAVPQSIDISELTIKISYELYGTANIVVCGGRELAQTESSS
jgi:hypothetical protein